MTTVRVFTTYDLLSGAAAEIIAEASAQAIEERGIFRVALSGGETPRGYLAALAQDPYRSRIDWTHWDVWWGDDRIVPHDNEASNVRLAREALLDHVPMPAANIHAPRTDLTPAACADAYEAELRASAGDDPRFDLVLLGIGEDGHTASLFPHTAALTVDDRLVIHTESPKGPKDRVTFTFKTINDARQIVFVVTGEAKAEPLRQVLAHHADPLPAARVAPEDGRLLWVVDCAVGRGLRRNPALNVTKDDTVGC